LFGKVGFADGKSCRKGSAAGRARQHSDVKPGCANKCVENKLAYVAAGLDLYLLDKERFLRCGAIRQ
jgi:hypothetical protein